MANRQRKKPAQSAMEYLMTYGWAILIIAVALAVLFQMGVFSGGNFTPKAQAGSCQVQRSAAGVSLEGQCNGMLPQFTAHFSPSSSSKITITSNSFQSGNPSITITAWSTTASNTYIGGDVMYYGAGGGCANGILIGYFGPQGGYSVICADNYAGSSINNGAWQFIAVSYAPSGAGALYINGANVKTGSGTLNLVGPVTVYIGGISIDGNFLSGGVSNVQIYNTSLSQAEITALYDEGIGGAPIRPQNLVGWWPLNGNANDYSGNNNNGAATGVTYNSSWSSSYTAP